MTHAAYSQPNLVSIRAWSWRMGGFLAVGAAILLVAAVPSDAVQRQPGKHLNFPPDQSLGVIYVRPKVGSGKVSPEWVLLGEARGQIAVSPDTEVRLDIRADRFAATTLARLAADDLRELSLAETPVSDDEMAGVARLTGLKVLRLGRTAIGDMSAKHLARLEGLEVLDLGDTQVTDAFLPHLSKLRRLQVLSLSGMKRTGADLAALRSFPQLERLYLRRCATDADLRHLAPLSQLRHLYLTGCPISDKGLSPLAGLTNLEYLDLNAARVTDSGIDVLKRLHRLQELKIAGRITGVGLQTLASLPAMRRLELGSRWLAPEAVEQTRTGHPKLQSVTVYPILLEVGDSAPNLVLPGVDGVPVKLHDLLRKRKAVLVSFWYLDCAPCLVELPVLQRIYPELQARGVEILSVNTFDTQEEVARHGRASGLTFPLLVAGSKGYTTIAAAFGVSSYPTNYLIGADGKVLWVGLGFSEQRFWDTFELLPSRKERNQMP